MNKTKTNNLPKIKKRIDNAGKSAEKILKILKENIATNIDIKDKVEIINYALDAFIDYKLHKEIFTYLKKEGVLKNLTEEEITSFYSRTFNSAEIIGLILDIADISKQ